MSNIKKQKKSDENLIFSNRPLLDFLTESKSNDRKNFAKLYPNSDNINFNRLEFSEEIKLKFIKLPFGACGFIGISDDNKAVYHVCNVVDLYAEYRLLYEDPDPDPTKERELCWNSLKEEYPQDGNDACIIIWNEDSEKRREELIIEDYIDTVSPNIFFKLYKNLK